MTWHRCRIGFLGCILTPNLIFEMLCDRGLGDEVCNSSATPSSADRPTPGA